jgi:hypothetical protein
MENETRPGLSSETLKNAIHGIRFLEQEMRAIDKALPLYLTSIAVVTAGYMIANTLTLSSALGAYSYSSLLLALFIQPYLLVFMGFFLYSLRSQRRLFFSILSRIYFDKRVSKIQIDKMRSHASWAQKYWNRALWFLVLYLIVSPIVEFLLYWRLLA